MEARRGKPLVWDFTCRDTFAPSSMIGSTSIAGYAASRGESDKRKRYEFLSGRYTFVPVACGKDGHHLIQEIDL